MGYNDRFAIERIGSDPPARNAQADRSRSRNSIPRKLDPGTTKGEASMIEALKSEDIVNRAGGRFKLVALIQRRLVEIMEGARPACRAQGTHRS